MLESAFILFIILAFLSLVIAVEWKSIVVSGVGLFFGILILAGHLWVVSGGTGYYEVYGMPLGLFFIFTNMIVMIVNFMDFKGKKRYY